MSLDEVVKSAISRAGVVRVRSALNPFLWCFVWTIIFAVLTYLLRDDAISKFVCLGMAALPEVVALSVGIGFAIKNPDRLQTEEFIIRQRELTMIEKKGGYILPSDQIDVEPIAPGPFDEP